MAIPDQATNDTGNPQAGPLAKRKLMLVAAEASGDALGAGLIRALNRQAPGVFDFVGVGGARMKEQGVDSPFDIAQLSILGLVEGLKALPRVKARVRDTVALARREAPDAVVLIDSWGFTLRAAQAIRQAMPDVPLIKYVGPQVWAARPGRAKTLASAVDFLIALHPMDPPFFEAQGLKTVVVGNPALHVDMSRADPRGWRQAQGLQPDTPVLLVLPGSRPAEIRHMMPLFGEVMTRLHTERPDLVFAMPLADTVRQQVLDALETIPVPVRAVEGETDKFSAMQAATLALACSGTVSTELALAGCPMVIAYKLEPLTFFIYKRISTLKHATMFNIMVDKRVAPEFIQGDANADNLVKAVAERLDDPALRARQVAEQYDALDVMGRGQEPPADKAAAALLEFLASR